METNEDIDFPGQSGWVRGIDDARVVVDFSVGSSGVGPVMGFGSDDFFPSAPHADPAIDDLRAGGGDADSP